MSAESLIMYGTNTVSICEQAVCALKNTLHALPLDT